MGAWVPEAVGPVKLVNPFTDWPMALAVLWVLGMLVAVFVSTAFKSGWRSLARSYKTTESFTGQEFNGCSGRLRRVDFSRALNLGANQEGLYLSTFALLRQLYPPLFIPWTDVRAERGKRWFRSVVVLEFRQDPKSKLELATVVAEDLAAASNSAFVLPEPPPDDGSAKRRQLRE